MPIVLVTIAFKSSSVNKLPEALGSIGHQQLRRLKVPPILGTKPKMLDTHALHTVAEGCPAFAQERGVIRRQRTC